MRERSCQQHMRAAAHNVEMMMLTSNAGARSEAIAMLAASHAISSSTGRALGAFLRVLSPFVGMASECHTIRWPSPFVRRQGRNPRLMSVLAPAYHGLLDGQHGPWIRKMNAEGQCGCRDAWAV